MSLSQDYARVLRRDRTLRGFCDQYGVQSVPHLPMGRFSYYDCGSHVSRWLESKYGQDNFTFGDEVPWSLAKPGDIIQYDTWHIGILLDPETRLVESCWGLEGLVFQHHVDTSPYGNPRIIEVIHA